MLVIADNMNGDMYVPSVAAMYLSLFYLYEFDMGTSAIAGALPFML